VSKAQKNRKKMIGINRGKKFDIYFNGERVDAYEGETVAAALIANGNYIFRETEKKNPRSMYCGIGLCNECMIEINGSSRTKACQTLATPNSKIETQKGKGKWAKKE
jgi:sarcosine oxidase subunit alpha